MSRWAIPLILSGLGLFLALIWALEWRDHRKRK
jgi:hypothetical protein